jgi:hypothetical protein
LKNKKSIAIERLCVPCVFAVKIINRKARKTCPAKAGGFSQWAQQNTTTILPTIPDVCRYSCVWQENTKKLRAVKHKQKNI